MATEASTIVPSGIQLSWWEKADLIPALLTVVTSAFYNAIAGVFRGNTGAKTYSVHVGHAVVRTLMGRLSMRQTSCVRNAKCEKKEILIGHICTLLGH